MQVLVGVVDGAIDIIVVVVEAVAVVVANEVLVAVAVAYKLTHNCSLRVLVHALFPHCLSCSK